MRGTTKDAEERMEGTTACGGAVRYVFVFVSAFVSVDVCVLVLCLVF